MSLFPNTQANRLFERDACDPPRGLLLPLAENLPSSTRYPEGVLTLDEQNRQGLDYVRAIEMKEQGLTP